MYFVSLEVLWYQSKKKTKKLLNKTSKLKPNLGLCQSADWPYLNLGSILSIMNGICTLYD